MPINFGEIRWQNTVKNYEAWWNGELGRPLVPLVIKGMDPGRAMPNAPLLTQATADDMSVSPESLIDRLDYELSTLLFLGDSFPMVDFEMFGPGVIAAFLGASLDNSTGRVWFNVKEQKPASELHFEYHPNNIYIERIAAIYQAGMKRWEGQVLMGMPDLGGVLDILATFLTTEELLMGMLDEPVEISRLIGELQVLWHHYYQDFSELLSGSMGHTDWSAIFSVKKSYIIQSDLSYMISPDMFDAFVLPEISQTCKKLPRTIYHLDGIGQLRHLDKLLAIKELDGVQWIPGDGQAAPGEWPEVYQKIHAAGKRIQICGYDALPKVISHIGTGKGIHVREWKQYIRSEELRLRRELSTFGIE